MVWVKSVCWNGWDCSNNLQDHLGLVNVYVGEDRIGQECMSEWARLIKLSSGVGGTGQDSLCRIYQMFCGTGFCRRGGEWARFLFERSGLFKIVCGCGCD